MRARWKMWAHKTRNDVRKINYTFIGHVCTVALVDIMYLGMVKWHKYWEDSYCLKTMVSGDNFGRSVDGIESVYFSVR